MDYESGDIENDELACVRGDELKRTD